MGGPSKRSQGAQPVASWLPHLAATPHRKGHPFCTNGTGGTEWDVFSPGSLKLRAHERPLQGQPGQLREPCLWHAHESSLSYALGAPVPRIGDVHALDAPAAGESLGLTPRRSATDTPACRSRLPADAIGRGRHGRTSGEGVPLSAAHETLPSGRQSTTIRGDRFVDEQRRTLVPRRVNLGAARRYLRAGWRYPVHGQPGQPASWSTDVGASAGRVLHTWQR